MKIFVQPTYTQIVRVEITEVSSKKMRSVSFCQTTLNEVVEHVEKTLKLGIVGIKCRIVIRMSDPVKRWGEQKGTTILIKNLDDAIAQISQGVEIINWKNNTLKTTD